MIYTGTEWNHITTGGSTVGTDLDVINRGTETLDIESSTGSDATVPQPLRLLLV